ncbi:MAG: UV DNA damage repair endonuclease UvsE [Candidatus Omnitrophica bacterium]|nr:UV DNA damage repair endonuclease UvsE [Candidatus Omnitrophota bacterium]MDE2222101.1 UV DNA damage repair endonuclease UvsE [Candidatus Omnitrophota bacterium]
MKIGYPCLNHTLGKQAYKTFRLASYSDTRFIETVSHNLGYLRRVLEFNLEHELKFFRISSGIIPFASHPVLKVNWQRVFKEELAEIGSFIIKNGMRISMHPDQFVLINSPSGDIVKNSVKDLLAQAQFLDLLGLDAGQKLQIHVGGVYAERKTAIRRFIANYLKLPSVVTARLVIENDDRNYPLDDCLRIHEAVGIPVLFDSFHHECLNQGETMFEAMMMAAATWGAGDGAMMVDYSSQQPHAVTGKHAATIDINNFKEFILSSRRIDFDLMLEIKDKEKSALKALELCRQVREGAEV